MAGYAGGGYYGGGGGYGGGPPPGAAGGPAGSYYGAPPPGAAGGYGGYGGAPPPGAAGGYGAPPPGAGYGAPTPGAGYGAPPPGAAGGYGVPPPGAAGGYGAPPPGAAGGYGAPPPGAGYGAPPLGGGYGAPPPGALGGVGGGVGGYGGGAGGGYGGAPAAGGWNPNQSVAGFRPTQAQLQGFGGQYYAMLDPMKITELRAWFSSVDTDKSGSISLTELQRAQFAGKTVQLDTAKQLLRMFDSDQSGCLGFFEFAALHQFVIWCIGAFNTYDADSSGRLNQRELTAALHHAGFQFQDATMDLLYRKFQLTPTGTATSASAAVAAQLNLDQFLRVCAYLGQIRSSFWVLDTDKDGVIQLGLEALVQVVSRMG